MLRRILQQFGFEIQVQHGNFALLRLGEGTIGLLKMDLSKWPNAPRGSIHIELSTENSDELLSSWKLRECISPVLLLIARGSDKCLLMTPMGIVWKLLRDGGASLRRRLNQPGAYPEHWWTA